MHFIRNFIKVWTFVTFVLFLIIVPKVSAQETIDRFDVEITAQENGEMIVEETIIYDFGSADRHGIFRYVPLISSVGNLYRVIDVDFQEVNRDGKKEKYEVDKGVEQAEVKIGDSERTITGRHEYRIVYVVKNGIGSNYEDHDEIYWNVTGNGWDVPIASASVLLKTDFSVPVGDTLCFTGYAGSSDANCQVEEVSGGKRVTITQPLNASEGVTFVSSFPLNTFPKSTLRENKPMDPDLKVFLWIVIPLLVLLNFILAPYLLWWYHKNKNKKRFGKPAVNFDVPEHPKGVTVSPAEVGTLDNSRLDKDDITATIFDLAIRKYIRIEQVKTKGKVLGIGSKEDHTLVKLKEFAGLNEFETYLLDSLFGSEKTVTLSTVPLSYTQFQSLEKKNFDQLIKKGFFTKNPAQQKGGLVAFGIVALSTGSFILSPVLFWLSSKITGRTQLGDELDWKNDGLKIFLKATNRYNTWQAKNFIFLEKMIPYAMALGFIDQYMKNLKVLKPEYSPTWYRGSGNFYTNYALFSSSVSSNVTTSAPSSSSGFSSGSSGGGGGGGGGGSW